MVESLKGQEDSHGEVLANNSLKLHISNFRNKNEHKIEVVIF